MRSSRSSSKSFASGVTATTFIEGAAGPRPSISTAHSGGIDASSHHAGSACGVTPRRPRVLTAEKLASPKL